MTPRRAIWVRYWLVVTSASACLGASGGASAAILTTATARIAAITGGVAGLLILCLGVYGTAGMRRAINQDKAKREGPQ